MISSAHIYVEYMCYLRVRESVHYINNFSLKNAENVFYNICLYGSKDDIMLKFNISKEVRYYDYLQMFKVTGHYFVCYSKAKDFRL